MQNKDLYDIAKESLISEVQRDTNKAGSSEIKFIEAFNLRPGNLKANINILYYYYVQWINGERKPLARRAFSKSLARFFKKKRIYHTGHDYWCFLLEEIPFEMNTLNMRIIAGEFLKNEKAKKEAKKRKTNNKKTNKRKAIKS